MAGSAVNNSVDRVVYHTASIADGNMTPGTTLGNLAVDGTDIPNPEIQTEEFFVGAASTGATMSGTIRILGTGGANLTTLNTAAVANPPAIAFLFFPNVSLTKYTEIQCRLTEPFQEPSSTNPKRTAWMVGYSAKGDAVSDFLTVRETAVTNI